MQMYKDSNNDRDGSENATDEEIGHSGNKLLIRGYSGDYNQGLRNSPEKCTGLAMEKLYELETKSSANAISALWKWGDHEHFVEQKAHVMKNLQIVAKSGKMHFDCGADSLSTETPTNNGDSKSAVQPTPAVSAERAERYRSGKCYDIMVNLIERVCNKNIHPSYRLEALQSLWDLTCDSTLLVVLYENGLLTALIAVLVEFCPKRARKVEGELDLTPITLDEDISLTSYLEQEFIRCMALLALANIAELPEVNKILISRDCSEERAQIVALCERHVRNYGNESLYAMDSHFEGAVADAMKPHSLARSSSRLIARMLGAMQTQYAEAEQAASGDATPASHENGEKETILRGAMEVEIKAMSAIMSRWSGAASNKSVGVKRSFIKSTRLVVC